MRWAVRLEKPLIVAAGLVIPALVLDQPGNPMWAMRLGGFLNWGTWLAFAFEFFVLLKVSPDRWRFARSRPIDVAVVFLTVPFLPTLFTGVRLVRLLRLFRLLRLAPLVRWVTDRGGVRNMVGFASLIVVAGGVAFAQFENISSWNGIYWAMTTVTTVGYGDPAPTRPETKVLACFVMVVGIAVFATLSGALAAALVRKSNEETEQKVETVTSREQVVVERLEAIIGRLDDLETRMDRG